MYEYEEQQSFQQRWIWFGIVPLLFLILAVFLYIAFRQLVLGEPIADSPMPNVVMILLAIPMLIVTLGGPMLLSVLRLVIRVNARTVEVMLVPLIRHQIPIAAIEDWRVRRFDRLVDYPGLRLPGVRISKRRRAYLIGGVEGVEIDLVGGKQLFLSSKQPIKLDEAIDRVVFGDPDTDTPRPTPG